MTRATRRANAIQIAISQTAIAIAAEQIRAPAGAKDADGNSIGGRWVDKDQVYSVESDEGDSRSAADAVAVVDRAVSSLTPDREVEAPYGVAEGAKEAFSSSLGAIAKQAAKMKARAESRISDLGKRESIHRTLDALAEVSEVVAKKADAIVSANPTVEKLMKKEIPTLARACVEEVRQEPLKVLLTAGLIAAGVGGIAAYGTAAISAIAGATQVPTATLSALGVGVAATGEALYFASAIAEDVQDIIADKESIEQAKADLEEAAELSFKIPEDILAEPQSKPEAEPKAEPQSGREAEPPPEPTPKREKTEFEKKTGVSEASVGSAYERLKKRNRADAEFFLNRVEMLKEEPKGSANYRISKGIVDAELSYGSQLDRFLDVAGDEEAAKETGLAPRAGGHPVRPPKLWGNMDLFLDADQKELEKEYDQVLDGSMSVEEFVAKQESRNKDRRNWAEIEEIPYHSEVDAYKNFIGSVKEGKARNVLGRLKKSKTGRSPFGENAESVTRKGDLPWWRNTPDKTRLDELKGATDDALQMMRANPDIYVALEEYDADRDSRLSVAETDTKYTNPLAGITRGLIGDKKMEAKHPDVGMLTVSRKPHPGVPVRQVAFREMGKVAEMQTESAIDSVEYTRIRNEERVKNNLGKKPVVGGDLNGDYRDAAANEITRVEGSPAILATGVVSTAMEKIANPRSLRDLATGDREHLMYALSVLDKPDARRKLFYDVQQKLF